MAKTNFFKKLLVGTMLAFAPITTLTGCSEFFGDEGYIITNVTTTHNEEEGYTLVTITFSDEEVAPVTFKIDDGETGNGIDDITAQPTQNGESILLTIIYSDKSKDPVTINVPVLQGNGIDVIETDVDENGDTVLVIKYTDGTSSQPITIKNGKDGNGIDYIDISYDADLNVIVTIYFTDPTKEPVTFTVTRAASILNIAFDEEKSTKDVYVFTIYYSDGTTTSFTMPAPQDGKDGVDGDDGKNGKDGKDGTVWHCSAVLPTSSDGKIGDYWIYLVTGDVYKKTDNTTWTRMFAFALNNSGSSGGNVETYADIIFSAEGATFTDEKQFRSVLVGKSLPLNSFPADPTMSGYTFIGWYTHPTNVNAGQFTDLTVVSQNMTVYARWVKADNQHI